MEYRLSILIPVYNKKQYISRCIKSLLQIKEINYEIIIVDDGSSDGSSALCDDLAKGNNKICVIHQKHLGLASARIAGILASRGDYIGFVDSDDYIAEQFYERLLSITDCDNSIDIVVGGMLIEENGVKKERVLGNMPMNWTDSFAALEEMFSNKIFNWSLCDKIYSKKLFSREILRKWPDGHGEDLYTNTLLFPKARKISFLPIYGYNYCMNYDSMMHADFNSKKLVTIYLIDEVMNKYKNRENMVINLGKILVDLSIDYFLQMHRRYPRYNLELTDCQNIINRWYERLDIEITKRKFLDILMKSPMVYQSWKTEILNRLYEFCANGNGKIYIYGTGQIGHQAADYLLKLSIIFNGFIETNKMKDSCLGYPVYSLNEISSDCYIILGLGMKNKIDVYNKIAEMDYHILDIYYYIKCI